MSETGVIIGTNRLGEHPLRAEVLGELHARPFTPIATMSMLELTTLSPK